MKVEKNNLAKSQVELIVELTVEEFRPFVKNGAEKVSREIKIEGFRPGKVPYDILKSKIGEMTILEEAARLAINKTLDQAIEDKVEGQPVGQPQINVTKLAPDNPFEYKAVLALLPEVTFGEYKGLKIKRDKVEVSQAEVDKMISELRQMRVQEKPVERPAREGDKVIADLEMFLDQVPLEGGQSKGVGLIIGQNYLVPGFSNKLVGLKRGDSREFSLPYPKDHHQRNLAGKLIEFRVKVNDIFERRLPEPDQKFAASFGAKSIEEFKTNIKKSLVQEKQQRAEQKSEIAMLNKIIDNCRFGDIPEILVNNETDTMLAELESEVTARGGNFADYLNQLKKSREQLTLDLLPEAIKRVKTSILIREIANKEKIEISPAEVEQEIAGQLEQYQNNQEVKKRILTPAYRAYLKNYLSGRKVINRLKRWNVE